MELNVKDLFTGAASVVKIENEDVPAGFQGPVLSGDIYKAPGLVDLQVNGYAGIDFNGDDLAPEKIEKATVEIINQGVTGFMPTLITGDPVILERNLGHLRKVIEGNGLAAELIMGIHLEGPFISAVEGARGAHPAKWIREPDISLIDRWQNLSGGNIRLLTMSPEFDESPAFIEECVRRNIQVAIGHTDASSIQIQKAVRAGASLSTHLGNAMKKMIHRHENILFEQMASQELYASIIADGHHLTKNLLRIMDRVKSDRLFLVSDSTRFAGMKPGVYDSIIGGQVELTENRRLFMRGNPQYLAGTASSLLDCVSYLVREDISSIGRAWEMASVIPARYLNIGTGPQKADDFNLFTIEDGALHILLTCKNQKFYSA